MLQAMLSFKGRLGRLPYCGYSIAIFLAQYLLVVAAFAYCGTRLQSDWHFWLTPFRTLAGLGNFPPVALPLAFLLALAFSWVLVVLAFRRARDADINPWIAAVTMIPTIQVPAIAILCVVPSREVPAQRIDTGRAKWHVAAQGVLAGAGLTLFAVAVGALVFGTYGFGMFVAAPFLIGATTAFLANANGDVGWSRTLRAITTALALGAIGLVITALEGVVCIVVAAPLAFLTAMLGGELGRAVATRRRSARNTLASFAILPLVFTTEYLLPPDTSFSTVETIDVNAPAHDVWLAIVNMGTIDSRPALPFVLGVAYPIRAEFIGQGVGALRRGIFSTGVALERVTDWQPDRRLAFAVLSSPPAMHELSFYAHVNAPHVKGYFLSTYTSFDIVPIGRNRYRVTERTGNDLKLEPVLYWLPLARWIVHEDNRRVLSHIQARAESVANTHHEIPGN